MLSRDTADLAEAFDTLRVIATSDIEPEEPAAARIVDEDGSNRWTNDLEEELV